MIPPYSQALRERAVALLDEGASSLEVAEILDVSDSWVRKMRIRREALGNLRPGAPLHAPHAGREVRIKPGELV